MSRGDREANQADRASVVFQDTWAYDLVYWRGHRLWNIHHQRQPEGTLESDGGRGSHRTILLLSPRGY